MVIVEEMFTGGQEDGEGGKGTVKMYGESSNSRMDKGAGFGQIVRFASREYYPPGPKSFRLLNFSAFKFKSLTHKKTVLRVAFVSSLESRF